MEAVEKEIKTQGSYSYLDSYFTKLPNDARFNKIEYVKVLPVSTLAENSKQYDFVLERKQSPHCYLIGEILIEVHVTIVKKTSTPTLPDAAKYVAPVNSCLHSLFKSCVVKISGQQISNTPDYYQYRSYFQQLLTFGPEVKLNGLGNYGWSTDSYTQMDGKINTTLGYPSNQGFLARNAYFRRNMANVGSAKTYKSEGAVFIGRLNHEMAGMMKPLPHLTPVHITLIRTDDKFYIMTEPTGDDEEYRVVVSEVCLHVPVAMMNQELNDQLGERLKNTPITYHYRRQTVLTVSIPRNKQIFVTDQLFPESENPIRIFFVLVETDSLLGDYKKNPFDFRRKWKGNFSTTQVALKDRLELSRMESKLELQSQLQNQKFNELFELLRGMQANHAAPSRHQDQSGDLEDSPLSRGKGKNVSSRMQTRSAGSGPTEVESSSATFLENTNPIDEENMPSTQSFLNRFTSLFSRRNSDNSEFVMIPTKDQVERARAELDKLERQVNMSSSGSQRGDQLDRQSTRSSQGSHHIPEDIPDPESQSPFTAETEFYLTKLQLEVNSSEFG